MKTPLVVIDFSPDLLSRVQHFDCGEEIHAKELAGWIRKESLDALTAGTKVWLYFTEQQELVGFGSLGTTNWKYPPPGKIRNTLAIIPAVAIQKAFWGKPDGPREERYSTQILQHLIVEASHLNLDIPFLALYVHPDNQRAIHLYEREGFQHAPQTYTDRTTNVVYRSMVRSLVTPAAE